MSWSPSDDLYEAQDRLDEYNEQQVRWRAADEAIHCWSCNEEILPAAEDFELQPDGPTCVDCAQFMREEAAHEMAALLLLKGIERK